MATVEEVRSDTGVINRDAWEDGRYLDAYAHRDLRPVEVLILVRYRQELGGRVLEVGCGAGRIAGYLLQTCERAYGIDLSERMLAECRRRYPHGDFSAGDIRRVPQFDDGSLDAVWAGCNLLDVFDDAERHVALAEIHRILRPGGLLVMSSHNRAHLPHRPGPLHVQRGGPRATARDLVRVPRSVWRHRRLRRLEREEPEYALFNSDAHGWNFVFYCIDPAAQFRQFEQTGFEPLECLDLDGRPLGPGETAERCSELHYVARRR